MLSVSFKLCLYGGNLNGAQRYYSQFSVAKREATKYLNRVYRTIGEHPYCEIYRVMPDGRLLFKYSIG